MAEFSLHVWRFHHTAKFLSHRTACWIPSAFEKSFVMFSIYFIQLKFRSYSDVRKGPAAMSKGEREKWRLPKSNEEKNSVNKNNFPQILFYKYPENLRLDFMLKKIKISQMRLISPFFYYSLHFKPESFEHREKQYLYSRSKIILLQLLSSTLHFLEESVGSVGFLRPVLDI